MIIYIYIYIYTLHISYTYRLHTFWVWPHPLMALRLDPDPTSSWIDPRPALVIRRSRGTWRCIPRNGGESVENVWRMWIIWIISRIRHIKSIQKPQKWRSPAFILHQRTILKSHEWSSDHEMASPKWAPTVWLSRSPIKIWVKHDAHRPKWLWINTY